MDYGGPLHEFSRLLMLGIKNDASLFCSLENEKSLAQCFGFAKKGVLLLGKVYCPVPVMWQPCPCHMACKTIARHLCKEPITSPMSDVPNYEIKEKLEMVIFLRTQLYNNYSCIFISIVVHSLT